jgi:hypothetical protein
MGAGAFDRDDSRGRLLRQLRRLVGGREPEKVSGSQLSTLDSRLSCGVAAIDHLLSGGGLRRGMLVEWVGGGVDKETRRQGDKEKKKNDECRMTNDEKKTTHSSFVIRHSEISPCLPVSLSPCLSLPLLAAREACREGGLLVVIDPARTFYPPAAAVWGIDLQRLIVVHPKSARDAVWAGVQSLRSPAVAAVWMDCSAGLLDCSRGLRPRRKAAGLTEAGYSERAFRRLQLAAQAGRAVGLVVRPVSARGQPSWADVRLGVENCGLRISDCGLLPSIRNPQSAIRNLVSVDFCRRAYVHLLRCRYGRAGGTAWIEIDDVAHMVREAREGYRLSALSYHPSLVAESR